MDQDSLVLELDGCAACDGQGVVISQGAQPSHVLDADSGSTIRSRVVGRPGILRSVFEPNSGRDD